MNNLVMNFDDIKVGTVIHNDNGNDYTVMALNPVKDRALLVQIGTDEPFYVGAYGLHKCRNNDNYCWGQGHYYMSDLDSATKYVLDIEIHQKKKAKIGVSIKYLKQQIQLCDNAAINAETNDDCDMFDATANFLSCIYDALIDDKDINMYASEDDE